MTDPEEKPPSGGRSFSCMIRPDATRSLTDEAESGGAEAQFALGRYYLGSPQESHTVIDRPGHLALSFTNAVPQNLPLAALWLRRAADQGHAEAARWLQALIARPPGVY